MFTGIVVGMGRIVAAGPGAAGVRLVLEPSLRDQVPIGGSVAVDGCCLTLADFRGDLWAFDVIPETISRTTLGRKAAGTRVNLELPLLVTDRLGGHFVQGHVDAVGEVRGIDQGDEADPGWRMTVGIPAGLRGQIVEKGSIAIDGVSLTVASATADAFTVALVPTPSEPPPSGSGKWGTPVQSRGRHPRQVCRFPSRHEGLGSPSWRREARLDRSRRSARSYCRSSSACFCSPVAPSGRGRSCSPRPLPPLPRAPLSRVREVPLRTAQRGRHGRSLSPRTGLALHDPSRRHLRHPREDQRGVRDAAARGDGRPGAGSGGGRGSGTPRHAHPLGERGRGPSRRAALPLPLGERQHRRVPPADGGSEPLRGLPPTGHAGCRGGGGRTRL
ncbi:MAG: riboflavin synthase [Planctomycetes bacterium]|nr:riboflavin synthase [Planctomycetota bacterium]